MWLYVKCHQCGKKNKVRHYETNRTDYAKRFGADFDLTCRSCGYNEQYNVDDIEASPQILRVIIGIIIWSLLFIYTLLFFATFLSFIPFLFFALPLLDIVTYRLFQKRDRKRAHDFNRHKFRR